jgi:streptogramin lyase
MNALVNTRTRLAAIALAVIGGLILAVSAAGETGSIHEFAVPTANSQPLSIVTGPDGNLWFTEFLGNKIARMTTEGAVTEFAIPTAASRPDEIDVGPDGNLWFAEVMGNKIGRIEPATGEIAEFAVPTANARPTVIAPAPDGNLWFTERRRPGAAGAGDLGKIGRITPSGEITEFVVGGPGSRPLGITAGSDGNVWFSLSVANKVGRIDPQSGAVTLFAVPTPSAFPFEMAAGPDGNVWFTEPLANKVARVTPEGVISEFAVPTPGSLPNTIRRGPDPNAAVDCAYQREALGEAGFAARYGTFGDCVSKLAATKTLWFSEQGGNRIGQITTDGVVFEYAIPTAASMPIGVTQGPDGAVWFAENATNKIGRLDVQSVRRPVGPGVRASDAADPASVDAVVDPD